MSISANTHTLDRKNVSSKLLIVAIKAYWCHIFHRLPTSRKMWHHQIWICAHLCHAGSLSGHMWSLWKPPSSCFTIHPVVTVDPSRKRSRLPQLVVERRPGNTKYNPLLWYQERNKIHLEIRSATRQDFEFWRLPNQLLCGVESSCCCTFPSLRPCRSSDES